MVMIGCNGIKYPEEFKLMLKELDKTNFEIQDKINIQAHHFYVFYSLDLFWVEFLGRLFME